MQAEGGEAAVRAELAASERLLWWSPGNPLAELTVVTRWLFPVLWLAGVGFFVRLLFWAVKPAFRWRDLLHPDGTAWSRLGIVMFALIGVWLLWIALLRPAVQAARTSYAITDRRLFGIRPGHVELVPRDRIARVSGSDWGFGVATTSRYNGVAHDTGWMSLRGVRDPARARALLQGAA